MISFFCLSCVCDEYSIVFYHSFQAQECLGAEYEVSKGISLKDLMREKGKSRMFVPINIPLVHYTMMLPSLKL